MVSKDDEIVIISIEVTRKEINEILFNKVASIFLIESLKNRLLIAILKGAEKHG